MNVEQTMEVLNGAGAERLLTELYGAEQVEEHRGRYRDLLEGYRDKFGDGEVKLFSSPGRTEISGNHTDHNHGKVLAGSINLDCVGVAAVNHSSKVKIVSTTFGQEFTVDLNNLAPSRRKSGTEDLVKGLLKGFQEGRCALYVWRTAVYYAEHPEPEAEKLKWWHWKDRPYPPAKEGEQP